MGFNYWDVDPRKKEFVALRMDEQLFQALKEKAQSEGIDLSEAIRQSIKKSIENKIGGKYGAERIKKVCL